MSNLYIGLMSGTSVDGVDAVLVDLSDEKISPIASARFDIPSGLQNTLLSFNTAAKNELDNYASSDVAVGRLLAKSVNDLLETTPYNNKDISAIGSHGQTIRHYPNSETPTTLQIGDPNIIAELTGITTVADFRRRDMAAGGQGAPLVPAFHAAFFHHPSEDRAILNLGGIANLTLLPADTNQKVIGFDTGPANCLLNDWIKNKKQRDYDDAGQWSASGEVNQPLLNIYLSDPYFAEAPPKSTGRDYFQLEWLKNNLNKIGAINAIDVQSTLAELTIQSVANDLRQYASNTKHLFVCGGGVHNQDLLERLQTCLPGIGIESTSAIGVEPDYVEATAFAWLAKQTLNHQTINLSSITGAKHCRILGGIYQA